MIASVGRFGFFVLSFASASVRNAPPWGRIVEEAYKIGVFSLPILLIISTFVGTNLALQGYNAFAPLGGQSLVGMFVARAGVREMAPIMVAAMVASKAGTEMASQIAVMKIRDQVDALEVMAINPYWYLVTPRFFGIILVLPALTIISIFTLLSASYVVSVYQLGLNGSEWIALAASNIGLWDFAACSIKSIVFGVSICLISCYCGFTTKPGPSGVGQATNAAVVLSAMLCAMLNYLLSELLFRD
jgi:phospholipid/cholesterol/gamma-HCH transport system permease protein